MKETWDGDKSIRWKEQSGKVSTGKDGKAEFEFTPKEEGSYLVEVSGVDEDVYKRQAVHLPPVSAVPVPQK